MHVPYAYAAACISKYSPCSPCIGFSSNVPSRWIINRSWLAVKISPCMVKCVHESLLAESLAASSLHVLHTKCHELSMPVDMCDSTMHHCGLISAIGNKCAAQFGGKTSECSDHSGRGLANIR